MKLYGQNLQAKRRLGPPDQPGVTKEAEILNNRREGLGGESYETVCETVWTEPPGKENCMVI